MQRELQTARKPRFARLRALSRGNQRTARNFIDLEMPSLLAERETKRLWNGGKKSNSVNAKRISKN